MEPTPTNVCYYTKYNVVIKTPLYKSRLGQRTLLKVDPCQGPQLSVTVFDRVNGIHFLKYNFSFLTMLGFFWSRCFNDKFVHVLFFLNSTLEDNLKKGSFWKSFFKSLRQKILTTKCNYHHHFFHEFDTALIITDRVFKMVLGVVWT